MVTPVESPGQAASADGVGLPHQSASRGGEAYSGEQWNVLCVAYIYMFYLWAMPVLCVRSPHPHGVGQRGDRWPEEGQEVPRNHTAAMLVERRDGDGVELSTAASRK